METIVVKIFCINKTVEIPQNAFEPDERQKAHQGGKLNLKYLHPDLIKQLEPTIAKYNGLITACKVKA